VTYDVQSPDAARLWAFLPDWRGGFDVTRSFKTDVQMSRSGTEQRRALRINPRFAVEYRTTVADDQLREANHFVRAWQNKPTIIPDFARWARTTAGAILGATAIVISPLPAWVAEGQNLVLCGAGGAMERVLVDSVAGTTINLADPLAAAWASGSVVRPTFFGMFDGRTRSARRHMGAAEFSVAIDCYPGGEPPRVIGTAWATLGSREIFTPVPDYAGAPSVTSIWPTDIVDYGQGRTAQFRAITAGQRLVEADFNGMDVGLTAQVEQFFDRMKGRRGAFYMPTWEKDFELAASAGSGDTTVTISGSDLATDFGTTDYAVVEEGLAVFLIDGTAIYRRITDISASGGNSVITVSAAWGASISSANLARICRMPLWRFGSDDMTTSWRTPLRADTRLAFQGVKA
jgi:hypothetical protein